MYDQMSLWDTPNVISSQALVGGVSPCAWPDGRMISPSGLDHAHVSLSVKPAREQVPVIQDIFGQSSVGLSRSASLQKSLENRLQAKLVGRGSRLYALTWKRWDMQSGPQICALRASVLPRSGNGSSGWQTPTTRDGKGQSGKGNRIKRGKNGRLHVANLCDQIVDLGRPDLVRSTSFRNWLMGYPESWEAARAMEMPSSRKSRKSSSKP